MTNQTSPTESQLNYAKILQINIPIDATKEDVSNLIRKKVDGDSEPNPGLIEFAMEKGLIFSKYIGKKALYNFIFKNISLEDKIAFFTFSIYRWLSEDRNANLNRHEYKDVFYEFAREHLRNKSFLKSLGNYTGAQLRFFGTIRFIDGAEDYGGSENTIAYKTCTEFLHSKFGIQKTKTLILRRKEAEPVTNTNIGEGKLGCFGLILMLVCGAVLLTICDIFG